MEREARIQRRGRFPRCSLGFSAGVRPMAPSSSRMWSLCNAIVSHVLCYMSNSQTGQNVA